MDRFNCFGDIDKPDTSRHGDILTGIMGTARDTVSIPPDSTLVCTAGHFMHNPVSCQGSDKY